MIRNTIKCDKCERNISKSNFQKHYNCCKRKEFNLNFSTEWIINDKSDCKCPYCSKIFPKMGIITHILRKHLKPELFKNSYKFFSNNNLAEGKKYSNIPWNKGLTKDTDNRVKKGGETFKERVNNGDIKLYWKNNHHTNETKKKIGEKLSKNNNGGRCKWFNFKRKNGEEVKLQGTWEVRFAKILEMIDENWIKLGVGHKDHSYIWKDIDNIEHYYTPDFFSPKLNKYFEVKGYWWGDDKNKMIQVIEQYPSIKIEIIMKKELLEYEKLFS